MLKKSAVRRIMVASIALFIFGILSFFPNQIQNKLQSNTFVENHSKLSIYLLDPYQYVARTQVVIKNNDLINQTREIVETLTINGSKSHYLPNGFQAILPSGTKLNDVVLQNGILKLDFNAEFLKIPKELEEDAIECLIFSLTELPGVEGILIYVNQELLITTPNGKSKLPDVLTRDYGVNKIYDLTSFKDAKKTTTYYVSKYENTLYYVPVTEITNEDKAKVEIIIERLKSSPTHQTNLMSYLNANAELLDYEILENDINVSFNHYLLDDFDQKTILEEVEYSIALSLMDTLNIRSVNFLIDGEHVSNYPV